MTFNSEEIVYSLEDNWDELVSITFVNEDRYLSFNSLAYEDEIGIELNDQMNYISFLKTDFKFELLADAFHASFANPINQNNFPDLNITVHLPEVDIEKLTRALNALITIVDDES